ncbi:DnaJ domain-containing protein, partial [Nostoc sp. NIES-2111]
LGRADLAALARMCGDSEPDGKRLLEAYPDRRFPGWSEKAEANGDAGTGRQEGPFKPAALTEQEAYEILGLPPGASADDIRAAHRSLMKKLHPDQGGSTYLATRVNLAKDVLLSRHR